MNIQENILLELEKRGELNSLDLAKEWNVDHQLVVGGLKSLQSLGDVISCDQISETFYELTDEGKQVLADGSHEFRVYSLVTETGIAQKDLLAATVEDTLRRSLLSVVNDSGQAFPAGIGNELKKRKLITEMKRTSYLIKKGSLFSLDIGKEETDISSDLLAKFSEMPTNNYVECGFWNFDSLFQPQQHPARDAHDTFFVSDPASTNLMHSVPESYVERVRQVHSQGAFGSCGYQSDWLLAEAEKNLLRTHTTAVSARMLYRLAQQDPVVPVRYFSIDRVFRNETLDATHLAEFHQVEGLVADYGLSLGHLKAVIRAFFRKLGLTQLRFKPAYNPYTEPSMEIFAHHPGLNKWVEIGNSGIFRPEMLRPMGLPDGLTVIAWGLSLERPTMIRYGYKNIRDLIGPRVDLNMVYKAPLCRLEQF
ncbi:Phenylalanine--tRNA ligase alpha subunit A [Fasciolopsis buskii]|uniref:phenylalanine--tRNA ligase n=1 Tax=Fasciolopsis buskii TaxID=27845 RepID=A0A8E0RRG6_9TREM|nr:Phenylalanine--tRNA ligase alpha subunit A [Fasciolopsis buski]